ncbi:hypothetical protein BWQ96_00401 [Gracilariopsis chorda]|uniref:RRM domain-containing protein n=1 Tax=Gracilariopsis chorda TaxID=448386 RepID=A0A2V3J5R9_9FLOR|nr:hypothetical protein BWQ96_00401 [Gracilariopsis chorda]|eukprot:PXF49749.1 hypothetical protein BWQ96_00401 [Gracilariopsis chorda]
MTSSAADFVLDEGLDEDEDVLAFQSSLHPPPIQEKNSPPQTPSEPPQSLPSPPSLSLPQNAPLPQDAPTAVIIDGLPISASRADLDALLDGAPITNVRLRRLEKDRLLRVRVQFEHAQTAAKALEKDGTDFRGAVISVKKATEERWQASFLDSPRHTPNPRSPRSPTLSLPDAKAVQSGFWSAFAAAKNVAERLEQGARHLGDDLERRLHVTEKVEQTKRAIDQLDQQYSVSKTVVEMTERGKQAAVQVDKSLGLSDGVNKVSTDVSGVARIVAREVDESFRVGDRARNAVQGAMQNDAVSGVAKRAMATLDRNASPGKSKSQPMTEEPEQPPPSTDDASGQHFEVGG